METKVDEIAERIYRLSTFLPAVGPKRFHVQPVPGRRGRSRCSSTAASARCSPPCPGRWRASWTSVGCAGSPSATSRPTSAARSTNGSPPRREATVTHGAIGCAIWLNDQAPRPPRALADDEVLDLGGRRVRRLDTPHVPHCWDAGLLYEETTGHAVHQRSLHPRGRSGGRDRRRHPRPGRWRRRSSSAIRR